MRFFFSINFILGLRVWFLITKLNWSAHCGYSLSIRMLLYAIRSSLVLEQTSLSPLIGIDFNEACSLFYSNRCWLFFFSSFVLVLIHGDSMVFGVERGTNTHNISLVTPSYL